MRLLSETIYDFGSILRRGARPTRPGEPTLSNLKLRFDDDPSDLPPLNRGPKGLAWKPRLAPVDITTRERVIVGAQDTLDRMDRQMQNLRELLGPDLGGPTGTRAA